MVRNVLTFCLVAAIPGGFLAAEKRPAIPESVVEFTEDGVPVIEVTLHALKGPERTRAFRFLLSTADGWTVLDRSVPDAFFWDEADPAQAPGIPPSPAALVKRMEVPGFVRDSVYAIRLDLGATVNPFMDKPVDGMLGMSFLGGTRFTFDAQEGRIRWWAAPGPGATLPIAYGSNHTPWINLTVGQVQVPALVNLGSMGGIDLPAKLKAAESGESTAFVLGTGTSGQGSLQGVNRVEAAQGAWTDIRADFTDGIEHAAVGGDVWAAAPVCFDFIHDRVSMRLDPAGRLPILPERRVTLPVAWDRTGAASKLVVVNVKPGSPMEKAGCRPGDELVRAGSLAGRDLNRRNLMALMSKEQPHEWTVKRDGRLERLHLFAPQPATQPGTTLPGL